MFIFFILFTMKNYRILLFSSIVFSSFVFNNLEASSILKATSNFASSALLSSKNLGINVMNSVTAGAKSAISASLGLGSTALNTSKSILNQSISNINALPTPIKQLTELGISNVIAYTATKITDAPFEDKNKLSGSERSGIIGSGMATSMFCKGIGNKSLYTATSTVAATLAKNIGKMLNSDEKKVVSQEIAKDNRSTFSKYWESFKDGTKSYLKECKDTIVRLTVVSVIINTFFE